MPETHLVRLVKESSAITFFDNALERVVTPAQKLKISEDERRYGASMLAFFAYNPTTRMTEEGTNPGLPDVYWKFISRRVLPAQPHQQEIMAIFLLLLTGFYRRQCGGRYNLACYTTYGQAALLRASESKEMLERRKLMRHTARKFELWQELFQQLHDHFLWERFVLPSHHSNLIN
ncbi:MAG TPA: hypothetical protein VL306_03045 [Methylomirabilota bacterium]|jgi:hypothetical protein|nr:hypothetical protein [Methylomirabilota bacterium]